MKKNILFSQLVLSTCMLVATSIASANVVLCSTATSPPTYEIPSSTTVLCGGTKFYNGALTVHGEFRIVPTTIFTLGAGSINNYGIIRNTYELILNNSASVLTNQASGIINSAEWLFIYQGKLDNYGVVNFATIPGDNGGGSENFFLLSGTYNNYGTTRFDAEIQSSGGGGSFNNQGKFEVTAGGKYPTDDYQDPFNFYQTKGESEINGYLRVGAISISGGKLSGNGTVVGAFYNIIGTKVVLSPGVSTGISTGTLTLSPNSDSGDVICIGCSTDIEIAGSSNADHLHVNGQLYLNNWKLNVQLRNGYIPAPGQSFNIISADHTTYYGPAPTYNLPKLPAGRNWSVNNNGTAITLTAN